MLNDFNNHRSKTKSAQNNFEFMNNNDEAIGININNQTDINNNYNKDLNDYLNDNKYSLNQNNNDNAGLEYYKKEIKTIRQEIILLKTKISENELVINQYKNNIK